MRIWHYYHCYGILRWREILSEHLEALVSSGLAERLDSMRLSFIGSEEDWDEAFALCAKNLRMFTSWRLPNGWEQLTFGDMQIRLEQENEPGLVLYAHTKGVTYPPSDEPYGGFSSQAAFNDAWRQSMTRATVNGWRRCVQLLESHEVVGCHWIIHPQECVGSAGESVEANMHFMGGNFWWARSDVIKRLEPPRMRNRYDAEMWLGHNNVTDVYDLTPGWPAKESFVG